MGINMLSLYHFSISIGGIGLPVHVILEGESILSLPLVLKKYRVPTSICPKTDPMAFRFMLPTPNRWEYLLVALSCNTHFNHVCPSNLFVVASCPWVIKNHRCPSVGPILPPHQFSGVAISFIFRHNIKILTYLPCLPLISCLYVQPSFSFFKAVFFIQCKS